MKDSLSFSSAGSRVLISLYYIFVPLPIKYIEIEKSLKTTNKKHSHFIFWYSLIQSSTVISSVSQKS